MIQTTYSLPCRNLPATKMAVYTVLLWGELALLFLHVARANEPQGLTDTTRSRNYNFYSLTEKRAMPQFLAWFLWGSSWGGGQTVVSWGVSGLWWATSQGGETFELLFFDLAVIFASFSLRISTPPFICLLGGCLFFIF